MKKYSEFLVYMVLIILAGALSLLLVTDILQAKAERAELSKPDEGAQSAPQDDLSGPVPMETAIGVFKDQANLFSLLVTPKPTPTQPILPTPTETPIPLINENWAIKNIFANVVQLTTGDKKTASYKEGDPIPKNLAAGPVMVLYKIDKANQRVFLWRKTDNVMGWFSKAGGVEYVKELPQ
jgi:hypothetical protein